MKNDLKSLLPDGPISFWPEWVGAAEDDDDWVVGVALDYNGKGVAWARKRPPGYYAPIATINGKKLAKALAKHLQAIATEGSPK